jgi:hypothetical protein
MKSKVAEMEKQEVTRIKGELTIAAREQIHKKESESEKQKAEFRDKMVHHIAKKQLAPIAKDAVNKLLTPPDSESYSTSSPSSTSINITVIQSQKNMKIIIPPSQDPPVKPTPLPEKQNP